MARDYFIGDPRTNRERMLAGDLYIADDPESGRIAERAARLLEEYRVAFIAGDPTPETCWPPCWAISVMG